MAESISELRKICQDTRESGFYYRSWVEKNIYRGVSIYFTKLFLKIGISANQTTVVAFLVMIAAGILFAFGDPRYWVIGALLLFAYSILDRVDGELARYNRSASTKGAYLESVTYYLAWPFVLACMSFGIYSAIHTITAFIVGFLAVVSSLLFSSLEWLKYHIFDESGLLTKAIENDVGNSKQQGSIVLRLGRLIYTFYASELAILVVSLIDYFLSPDTGGYIPLVASLEANARYLYLSIYGIAMFVAVIVRISYNLRSGVRLR